MDLTMVQSVIPDAENPPMAAEVEVRQQVSAISLFAKRVGGQLGRSETWRNETKSVYLRARS